MEMKKRGHTIHGGFVVFRRGILLNQRLFFSYFRWRGKKGTGIMKINTSFKWHFD